MLKNEILQTSPFLRIIKRNSDYAIYHSLLGNLCIVDEKIIKLFKKFRQPQNIIEIVDNNLENNKEDIKQFIEIFTEKGFLVKPGIDEYSVFNKISEERRELLVTAKQIGIIQLVVTNACNFRCEYCFTNSIYSSLERADLQKSQKNIKMSPKDAIKYIEIVIDKRIKSGEKTLHIQFFGGEPLINWETIRHVLDHFENGERYNINITYGIVTNGSLITEEVAMYFKKYNIPVVVSFDSPKAKNRIMHDGTSSFEKIINGISILSENGNRVIFNSVLSKETFDNFDFELIDFAKKNNVCEIGVLLDLDLEFYNLRSSDEIVDKLWTVYKYGKERGVLVTGYWHMIYQQIIGYKMFIFKGYKTCSAIGCQLSIEPTGDVFACKGSSAYFGKIQNINELLCSDKYEKYAMRIFRNSEECKGCEIEHFCSGVCLGSLEKKYNDIYMIERKACDVYKKIVRKLIEDIDESEIDSYLIDDIS